MSDQRPGEGSGRPDLGFDLNQEFDPFEGLDQIPNLDQNLQLLGEGLEPMDQNLEPLGDNLFQMEVNVDFGPTQGYQQNLTNDQILQSFEQNMAPMDENQALMGEEVQQEVEVEMGVNDRTRPTIRPTIQWINIADERTDSDKTSLPPTEDEFNSVNQRIEQLIRYSETPTLSFVPTLNDVLSKAQNFTSNLIEFPTPDMVEPMVDSLQRDGYQELAQEWEQLNTQEGRTEIFRNLGLILHLIREIIRFYPNIPNIIESYYVGSDWNKSQIYHLKELLSRIQRIFKIWSLELVRHLSDETDPYLRRAINRWIAFNETKLDEESGIDPEFDERIFSIKEITPTLRGVERNVIGVSEVTETEFERKRLQYRNYASHLKWQNRRLEQKINTAINELLNMTENQRQSKKGLELQKKLGAYQMQSNRINWYINAGQDPNVRQFPPMIKLHSSSITEEGLNIIRELTENNIRDLDNEIKEIEEKRNHFQRLINKGFNEESGQRLDLKLDELQKESNYKEFLRRIVMRSLEELQEWNPHSYVERGVFNRTDLEKSIAKDNELIKQQINELIQIEDQIRSNPNEDFRNRLSDLRTEIGELSRSITEKDYLIRKEFDRRKSDQIKNSDLDSYSDCLDRIRKLSIVIIEEDPKGERLDEIYNELFELMKSLRLLEYKFEGSRISRRDLENLLRNRAEEQESKELTLDRDRSIDDMDLDDLRFFDQQIRNSVNESLVRFALSFLNKISFERKLSQQSMSNKKRNEMEVRLREIQSDCNYDRILYEINSTDLQRLSDRINEWMADRQGIQSKGRDFASSIPNLPTVEELVIGFRDGIEEDLILNPYNMRHEIERLEMENEQNLIDFIKKIIERLKTLERNIQQTIDNYIDFNGTKIGETVIDNYIVEYLERRVDEIKRLIDVWNQSL